MECNNQTSARIIHHSNCGDAPKIDSTGYSMSHLLPVSQGLRHQAHIKIGEQRVPNWTSSTREVHPEKGRDACNLCDRDFMISFRAPASGSSAKLGLETNKRVRSGQCRYEKVIGPIS